jgi:L-amino acid N-acyltransferase YncA
MREGEIHIRKAEEKDLPVITEIYNDAIQNTIATFDTTPKTIDEERVWFIGHGPKNPIMVAEHDGKIIAWGSLSKWSDRYAYNDTAETSLYVIEPYRGQGVGKHLLRRLLEEGHRQGLHAVIARVTEGNTISLAVHESLGFTPIGVMKEVGEKFGKRLDVYLMEKILR